MIENKPQALAQKRHLKTDFQEICDFPNVEYICFPESSQVLRALQVATESKTSLESLDAATYREAIERCVEIEKQDWRHVRRPALSFATSRLYLHALSIAQGAVQPGCF